MQLEEDSCSQNLWIDDNGYTKRPFLDFGDNWNDVKKEMSDEDEETLCAIINWDLWSDDDYTLVRT